MVKIERTVNITKCDVCESEEAVYRKCGICEKDVCQNCVVDLFKKKKRKPPDPYTSPQWPVITPVMVEEEHQYIDSMCKSCYDLFKQVVKKRITI